MDIGSHDALDGGLIVIENVVLLCPSLEAALRPSITQNNVQPTGMRGRHDGVDEAGMAVGLESGEG